jgi:hypothetical protein
MDARREAAFLDLRVPLAEVEETLLGIDDVREFALLHGCCTPAISEGKVNTGIPRFAGNPEVGDAGFEPATSAV